METCRQAKRILVTGANGFVGTHLMQRLFQLSPQADIRTMSRTGDSGSFEADIVDRNAVTAVIADFRPDIVYHLAGYASVSQAGDNAGEAWRVNFVGSLNLASAIAKHAPNTTMLHVSSSEVYGQSFNYGIVTEETLPQPASIYGRTKLASETMLGDIYPKTGKLIVVRPFNHTGPGQDERFVVPNFAGQLLRNGGGTGVINVGNLEAQREFLDVRDVVRAYTMLVDTSGLPQQSVFNIASGKTHKIRDVLERLQVLSGCSATIRRDPSRLRPSDIPCAVGSASKIADLTGWKVEIPFEQTLLDTIDHLRKMS